ncbi:MerR family transcriptional regulator [Paenibacillus athensensis]|nr:MerR family transcriptional regulator [Paenibacillus athensensis]MCD1258554.1 MerR family transcriptional regulator [Paenibacillus athensensis]
MTPLIKIGLFSKLAQVTVRTLRHYDDIGLLAPAQIDPHSGYRYYTYDQLAFVHQIQAFKDAGLSLEQIKEMMDRRLSTDTAIGLLTRQRDAIASEIRDKTEQVQRLDHRLHQLQQMGEQPRYDIVLKQVPAITVASIRTIVPLPADMPRYRCALFDQLERWLELNAILTDQEYVRYHMSEFTEADFDIEAAVAIQPGQVPSSSGDAVQLNEWPAEPLVASLIHRGAFMDVGHALFELFKWLGLNGYTSTGPVREIHWFGRENHCRDYNDVLVELQAPVAQHV